ncbi:choice-of-anchor L domain-containing protein, partial [Flavobacterium terrigena]
MKKVLLLLLFMFAGLNVFGQENFEGGTFPPTGWTFFETGAGSPTGPSWAETSVATLTYGGVGKSAYLNRENVTDGTFAIDWLVTNLITVPANGQLRFFTKTVQSGNQLSLFDIKVSTTSQTNPTSFTNVISWDESSLTSTANVYEEKVVDLVAYAGQQIYIAFVMTNDNGDRWLIDNMNIVQKCNAPIGPLTTANESTSTANLSWGTPPGITQWEVEIVPFADTFDNIPNQPIANTNVNFLATGLLPNTLYKFQVRSVCTGALNNYPSDWFGPRSFQTASFGDTCAGPIIVGGLTDPLDPATFVPGLLPYATNDNTANYIDSNDIQQPLTCSGSALNFMQGNDVFYSFTPTFTGNIAITLSPTNTSSSIHVYSACPGSPGATCLAGVANNNSNPRTILPFPVVANTTYYIIISSSSANQTVGYTLNIERVFCNQPTALTATNITTTSADLSWANNPGTIAWQVALAPAPYGVPTGPGVPAANPYLATSLVPGVVYQYYVRADCNDGNFSPWAGPFTFVLPQVATALNFTDGLETLTGWTLNNGTQSNKWAVGTGINNGGTHSLYVTDTNGTTNTYNITATSTAHAYKDFIIPAGATQLDFTFDWRSNGETGADYFRVWTVPTSTVITAGTQITTAPATPNKIKVGNDFASSSTFTTQNYTLNAVPYAGSTMRVVFEWRNNNTLGNQPPAAIDNIKLNLVPCPKPLNPTITNINYNNAQVNWANGATETQWEVIVLPTGSPAPTAGSVGVPAGTNPFIITGLTSVTCYDVYVRAVCSPTEVSFWSTVATFCTTPHFCAGDHFYDNGGAAGDYTNNQNNVTTTVCPDNAGDVVTVIFNQFNVAAGDVLVIRNGNLPTSPVLGTYTGTTLPPSFTATNASGCLTFTFTSNATIVSPGWDATIYCTPPITCPKPTTLTVTNITTTSVQLNWTEAGTATQWEILVLPLGSPVPAPGTPGTLVSTNPFTWTPLTPGTAYTFFVRAICSPTDASFWSNGANFYTRPTNDNCATPLTVPVNADMACTVATAGTITGATNSGLPTSTCGGTTDDDTWFSFTATSATHIINFNDIVGTTTDLSHAVYSGSCGALTLFYCDTNNFSYNNAFVIGQTYYIRVWSEPTAPNQVVNFNVCINRVGPPIFAENSSTVAAPTTYTVAQLVTDVLVTSPCGIVSNITSSTGSNFGQQNGIGYFNKNGSSFGLDEGIILATREANKCDGPNDGNNDAPAGWPGDAQLLSYMQSLGIDPGLNSYNNSSILEFDFVPIADQIKFDFIFASDEYGTYQCSFSDAFAFFLTNTTTGTTTNLAVIPGTTPPVPVAVTTIRNTDYNSGCGSANPTYFDKFYGDGNPQDGLPDVIDPTNFKGYTIPMSATGTVIPGQTYHMKFVVGDRNDGLFDSAVFLSKFDIGSVDLGTDLTVNGNSALCAGQSYTINSGLTAPPYGFTWYYMAPSTSTFVELTGQTGPTLNVTLPGEYKLVAQYVGSSCVGEDTIVVEFYPDLGLLTPEPNDMTICTANPVFDLTQNTAVVTANFTTPSDYQVTYYLTEADAAAGTNVIPNPSTYTNVTNPQTIWVRIYNTITFCAGIKNFEIEVVSPPTVDITYNSAPYCFNDGVANVTLTGAAGGSFSIAGNPLNISIDSNGTITWTDQVTPGSYTIDYAIGSGACSANDSFTININAPITAAFTSSDVTVCEGSSGTIAVTFSGTPGATVTYNDGTSNQTIFLDATTGNATFNHTGGTKTYSLVNVILGNCTQALTGTVVITINPLPQFTIPANLTFCAGASNTISVNPINFNLSDVTYAWTFNNNPLPDITSSIVVNQSGTYGVTVTTAQTCFSTQTCVVNSIAMPVADVLSDVNYCDQYVLPALSPGNSYHTAANGLGTQLNAGDVITSSQTIYIFAQTATTPNCTDQSDFDVTIVNSPDFDITGQCEGNEYVLSVSISNPQNYSFVWMNSSNIVVGTNSSTLAISSPDTYSCTITNLSGFVCSTQVSKLFNNVTCDIQKGISPNGDGSNDYLELVANKVEIFNRYGKEVYSKTNYNNDWHGQFMG